MKLSSKLSCIIFFIFASTVGSSAELTQDLRSVTVTTSEDLASSHAGATVLDISRELKNKKVPKAKKTKAPKSTKKPKAPKSGKNPKSSKTLVTESPSSPPTDDPCVAAGIITQKDALLALKAGFTNADDTILSDWDSGTEPCNEDTSNWGATVECNSDGEVTKVNLSLVGSKTPLEGSISPLIGCPTTLVSSLTNLNFDENNLTGTIPTELGALTNLTYLNFSRNNLTGTIPMELGALISLTDLNFSTNKLTGTIPTELGALTNLKSLMFYYNDLSGTMPTEICNLTVAFRGLSADCTEVICYCCLCYK